MIILDTTVGQDKISGKKKVGLTPRLIRRPEVSIPWMLQLFEKDFIP